MQITIIGCGIVGATIAYELSLISGLHITVIEQKPTFAWGATGAALGVLMGVISQKTKNRGWRLREASLRRYTTLIPELEQQTGIKIPLNRQGVVKLLFAEDYEVAKWLKLQAIRQEQGWLLEIWDLDTLHHRCPQINQDQIIAAIYSPQDTQIHPTILTQALVQAASQNGVRFQFDTKIAEFIINNQQNKQQCDRLKTSNGNLDVDQLIITAGLGSTPITKSLEQLVDIRPVLGQALKFRLDRPVGNPNFQPVVTGQDRHLVPLGNGEYWLGATVEFPNSRGEIVAEAQLLDKIKQDAINFCPALAQMTILETWMGNRPRPQGQPAPIIGYLSGYHNVLLATGHYRNGVLLAPATAMEVKKLLHRV